MRGLLLVFILVRVRSEEECFHACVCLQQKAFCDNMQLQSLPDSLPTDVVTLSLNDNKIRNLHKGDFKPIRHIQHLMMKANGVVKIERGALEDVRGLRALSLSENKLKRFSKGALRGLNHLQVLTMRNNQIRSIENLLDPCIRLQLINLSHNRIRHISSKTFRRNVMLGAIDISDNRLKSIHEQAFAHLMFLRYLVLRDNPLKALEVLEFSLQQPLELLDMTNCNLHKAVAGLPNTINDLRISENAISTIDKSAFSGTKKIRLLVLTNNDIEEIEEGALEHLAQLHSLYLGGNHMKKLPKDLPKTLTALFMNFNNISQLNRYQFAKNTKLETLFLSNNDINRIDSRSLRGLESLTSLDLSNNQIRLLEPLTFADNTRLQKLDISNNPLIELGYYCMQGLDNLNILAIHNVPSKAVFSPEVLKDAPRLQFVDASSSPSITDNLLVKPQYLENIRDLNLMNNGLHNIPISLPNFLSNLMAIKLSNNPWHCDLKIYPLSLWMRNRTVEFFEPHRMTCMSPSRLKGRKVSELMMEDLSETLPTRPPHIFIDVGLANITHKYKIGKTRLQGKKRKG